MVDKTVIASDPHFADGCSSCHKGDEKAQDKVAAHKGLVKRPSDNLSVCGRCHDQITSKFKNSLHYTTAGLKHGMQGRMGSSEAKTFNEKVFPKACNSCHASCGDCHVKIPVIGGLNIGLIKGHQFVRRDEGKTCALCHGGRVYPEFTGEYGGTPDVHYQKGMICVDCHNLSESHGDGTVQTGRKEIKDRPTCQKCHPSGSEKSDKAREAHSVHGAKLSCVACHSSGDYRNCTNCHEGKGATSSPGFILGLNPRDGKTVTTLRIIPTVRNTFAKAGVKMEKYDALPNYWDTSPHNIKKRTDRTRSCDTCHVDKTGFLTRETLIKGGSKANERLIREPKPLK